MKKSGVVLLLGIFVISSIYVIYNIHNLVEPIYIESSQGKSDSTYIQQNIPKASDAFDPNDDFFSAAFIGEGYYPNLDKGIAPDEDWYYIWVNENETLIVNIYFLHSNGDLNLELYNSTNNVIFGSFSGNDNEFITYKVNQSDNYYIRVYNQANPSYDLEIKIDDIYEENDVFSSAVDLIKSWYSFLKSFDDDWYRIWINNGEQFTIDMYFSHSIGDLNMELRDDANTILTGSYSSNDDESITWIAGYSGYYYIYIYNLAVDNTYDLDIYTSATVDDSYEENDFFSDAKEIYKGYYSSLRCEDNDWFKFWIDQDEELIVKIYFIHNPPSMGDLNIELYDDTYIYLTGSYSADDDEYISWIAGYSGYYYINIYNLGDNNNYDLDIYTVGDKFEPNNDFWSASEVYKGYYRHLHCNNDDWYKFYTNWGESYTVDIYFNNSYGNLDLEIYDDTNSEIAHSKTFGDGESAFFTANYYGFYFIRVYNYSSSDENGYEMKIGSLEITIFYEDFEGPISSKWSGIGGNNYMHVTSRDFSPSSPSHSLWCGNESTGTYNKLNGSISIPYKESVIINDLDLTDFCYVELSFDVNISIGPGEKIYLSVDVLGDQFYLNPKYTDNIFEMGGTSDNTIGWETQIIDLSFFCGFEDVDLIFSFEVDEFHNDYEGIKLDNIHIKGFKDNNLLGNSLGISVGDEYYYYIPYINHHVWNNEIFGKEMYLHSGSNIKLEIFSITDKGLYWDIVSRFWEPWDDFDELKGTDEVQYRVYKNPLNMKGSNDFFIPSGNVMQYLSRADNYDGDWATYGYNIEHWYEYYWGEYNIEFCYDDFRVHLKYKSNGVLEGMIIYKNYDGMERIFEMWRGEPYEDDDDDEDDEERRAVPGYDPLIIISLISLVSIIMVKKIKKSRK